VKTCLIVGASGSIGRATIRRLTDQGAWACVPTTSRSDGPVGAARIDLTDPAGFADAVEPLPGLDGVVLCAGLKPQLALCETNDDHIRRMLAIHVSGPILLLKALEPKLRPGSAVVFISSVAASRGSYDPAYAAAKGGLLSLGRSLAREWAPKVRVNVLAPGLIEGTPVFESMTPEFRARHAGSTLLERLGTVEECASAIEFLLTHPHLSGTVLHMDGGQFHG